MHAYVRAHTYGRAYVRTYVRTFVRTYEKWIEKKRSNWEKLTTNTNMMPTTFQKRFPSLPKSSLRDPKSSPGRFKKVSGHHEGFRNAPGVDPNNFFLKFWLILVPKIGPESEKKPSEKTCRFAFPFWVEFLWFRKAFWRHLLLRRKSKNELLV